MMLSIIMPVYNAGKYLSKCIESIINQDSGDWELIIIDDGSTDDSSFIIDKYATSYKNIKALYQHNMGPSAARNAGINLAIGDFISFVDSDDFITSDYVSTILREIKDFDILFWGFTKHYINGDIVICEPIGGTSLDKIGIEKILCGLINNSEKCAYFGFTWNKAFRSSIVKAKNITFNEDLRIKEDELFVWNYCAYIKSCKVLQKSLYHYRILGDSLSHSKKTHVGYALLSERISAATLWVSQPCLRRLADWMIFNYTTNAVIEAIKNNDGIALSSARHKLLQHHDLPFTTFNLPLWFKVAKLMPKRISYQYVFYYLKFYVWRKRL